MLEVYQKLPVGHNLSDGKVRSKDVILENQVKFSTLLLETEIHDGLTRCGYVYLSPIQQNALPLALTGSSVIAHAKSGTGKTLIYLLTILNDFVKRKPSQLQYLIFAPTREIAVQIYDVFRNVACFVKGLHIEFFIGGTPIDMDVIKCKDCHVGIGAPGRVKHLIGLGALKTTDLQVLVLDEVDALLDHEEYGVMDSILLLPPSKQLIVCTATLSSEIGNVVKSIASDVKYVSIEKLEIEDVDSTSNVLLAVKQYVAVVPKDSSSIDALRKREKLVEILQNFDFEQCFVFVNYISLVKSICNLLNSNNFAALWISSEQNQSARINTLNKLKMNHCKILVTTDLAARGIDVHKVNLVINLGLPYPADVYIHRMGRAGRYGSEGAVITILSENEEFSAFTKMISVVSTDPVDLHVLPPKLDSEADVSACEVIRCLPAEDSISEDEFLFKRRMKDVSDREMTKKQSKTNKKKKRVKCSNYETDKRTPPLSLHQNSVNTDSTAEVVPEVISLRVRRYTETLIDLLAAGKPKFECDSLKVLFEPNNGLAGADEAAASRRLTCFLPNPSENLLGYAAYARRRNQFLDEQEVPCSVDEYLNILGECCVVNGEDDNDAKVTTTHATHRHSPGLDNLIKDVCAKIGRNLRQNCELKMDASCWSQQHSKNLRQISSNLLAEQSLRQSIVDSAEPKLDTLKMTAARKNRFHSRISGAFSLADEFSSAMSEIGQKRYDVTQADDSRPNISSGDEFSSRLVPTSVNDKFLEVSEEKLAKPFPGSICHNFTSRTIDNQQSQTVLNSAQQLSKEVSEKTSQSDASVEKETQFGTEHDAKAMLDDSSTQSNLSSDQFCATDIQTAGKMCSKMVMEECQEKSHNLPGSTAQDEIQFIQQPAERGNSSENIFSSVSSSDQPSARTIGDTGNAATETKDLPKTHSPQRCSEISALMGKLWRRAEVTYDKKVVPNRISPTVVNPEQVLPDVGDSASDAGVSSDESSSSSSSSSQKVRANSSARGEDRFSSENNRSASATPSEERLRSGGDEELSLNRASFGDSSSSSQFLIEVGATKGQVRVRSTSTSRTKSSKPVFGAVSCSKSAYEKTNQKRASSLDRVYENFGQPDQFSSHIVVDVVGGSRQNASSFWPDSQPTRVSRRRNRKKIFYASKNSVAASNGGKVGENGNFDRKRSRRRRRNKVDKKSCENVSCEPRLSDRPGDAKYWGRKGKSLSDETENVLEVVSRPQNGFEQRFDSASECRLPVVFADRPPTEVSVTSSCERNDRKSSCTAAPVPTTISSSFAANVDPDANQHSGSSPDADPNTNCSLAPHSVDVTRNENVCGPASAAVTESRPDDERAAAAKNESRFFSVDDVQETVAAADLRLVDGVSTSSSSGVAHVRNSSKTKNSTVPDPVAEFSSEVLLRAGFTTNIRSDRARIVNDGRVLPILGRQPSVILPSLRSHVSAQQEQNIWRHHFAFISRSAASRCRSTFSDGRR